jgi:Carbohydrate-binding module 48 (Isoamylase N-terminal domain)
MDLTTVTRCIARLEYAAVRLPFGLLEDHFIARYWDQDAPIRVGFENLLGSLDEFAGRLLDDEEMRRRGQALRRETGAAEPDSTAGPEAASPWAQAAADPPGTVDVIFTLPADVDAARVALCGDFNDWSPDTIGCARTEDGTWQAIVALKPGRSYRYRYLLDGERWENAQQADRYLPNPFGGVDSVVVVE